MSDRIYESFLTQQRDEGLALARDSDLVHVLPLGQPANRFVVVFSCTGLVLEGGVVRERDHFEVGIQFPSDYLRYANPLRVLTWLGPANVYHPNIAADAPVICVGRLTPGTGLVDLIYQCFEIITWQKRTLREDDALNRSACEWGRRNPDRWPVDRRPLKRRVLEIDVEDAASGDGSCHV